MFYPIGHFYAKKAIKLTSPSIILFIRSFFGGIVLIILSLIIETQTKTFYEIGKFWPLILFNGIFIYHISKILWYEGIKRIDISKAIPLSLGGYPVFSLIFVILLLKEIPNIYQIIGAMIILTGIFILLRKTKIQKTNIKPVGVE